MKKNLTEVVFILDKSGSMSGLESDTVGGFNSMIRKQKKQDGEAYISTVLFSDESQVLHDRKNLSEVAPLTADDYCVGGCTALLDAVGDAVRHIANIHKYAREEDRPEHTVFIITTDGQENSSSRYSYESLKKLVERQKEQGWEFVFLGANIDSFAEARKFGISRENAVDYKCDAAGTAVVFDGICSFVARTRCGAAKKNDWRRKIDLDFMKRR